MRLVEHFFRLLAPSDCLRCSDEGKLLCAWCMEEALPEVIPRCYRCNKLSPHSATCPNCRRNTSIRHLFVRTEYSDIPRQLVHLMKFNYSGEAADVIGREMLNTLPALHPETIIVPIPTIPGHIRQRGIDHSRRIARQIALGQNLFLVPALARISTSRQVGASRQTRIQQMKGAFRVKIPAHVSGTRILLVDDVLTTGATMEAAAKALHDAGAKTIDAVIFAQAK